MWIDWKVAWANVLALVANALFLVLAIAKTIPFIVPVFAFIICLIFCVWLSLRIQRAEKHWKH